MSEETSEVQQKSDSTPVLRPTARAMAIAVGLAAANALWALFQWTQLVASRTGGSSFCGLSESTTCAEVWDSAFATFVHETTGMPVAGLGLVWSLAALALPLAALARRAGANAPASEPDSSWIATIWMAIGGVVAVAVLIAASLVHGALCTTCAVTYTLVAAYAAVCFVQTPPLSLPLVRGISPATISLAVALAVLFVPGFNTPMNEAAEGRKALLKVAGEKQATFGRDEKKSPPPQESSQPEATPPHTPLEGVQQLLVELPPQLRQLFADELLRYASSEPGPSREARTLIGSADAPVRLTEFTDVLCSHCANLHETVAQLRAALPPGSFSLEPRHFPLDADCNPSLDGESTLPVRCLAAKATICMEGRSYAFDFAGLVYRHQRGLREEQVYELAAPFVPREELDACIADPATQAKLEDDIAWANEYDIQGTPLVLLNGRPVAPFGPLLYALILTRGDPDHPVFADLPEGVLRDPHAGHDH